MRLQSYLDLEVIENLKNVFALVSSKKIQTRSVNKLLFQGTKVI